MVMRIRPGGSMCVPIGLWRDGLSALDPFGHGPAVRSLRCQVCTRCCTLALQAGPSLPPRAPGATASPNCGCRPAARGAGCQGAAACQCTGLPLAKRCTAVLYCCGACLHGGWWWWTCGGVRSAFGSAARRQFVFTARHACTSRVHGRCGSCVSACDGWSTVLLAMPLGICMHGVRHAFCEEDASCCPYAPPPRYTCGSPVPVTRNQV